MSLFATACDFPQSASVPKELAVAPHVLIDFLMDMLLTLMGRNLATSAQVSKYIWLRSLATGKEGGMMEGIQKKGEEGGQS